MFGGNVLHYYDILKLQSFLLLQHTLRFTPVQKLDPTLLMFTALVSGLFGEILNTLTSTVHVLRVNQMTWKVRSALTGSVVSCNTPRHIDLDLERVADMCCEVRKISTATCWYHGELQFCIKPLFRDSWEVCSCSGDDRQCTCSRGKTQFIILYHLVTPMTDIHP